MVNRRRGDLDHGRRDLRERAAAPPLTGGITAIRVPALIGASSSAYSSFMAIITFFMRGASAGTRRAISARKSATWRPRASSMSISEQPARSLASAEEFDLHDAAGAASFIPAVEIFRAIEVVRDAGVVDGKLDHNRMVPGQHGVEPLRLG